jgi:tetratricopeptide (TPR) repeat protein
MRCPRSLVVTVLWLASGAAAVAGPLDDGKRLLADRRHPEAAAAFRRALEASPSSRDAALGLGRAATEGPVWDAVDAAEEALQATARANPDDREVRVALGRLYLLKAKQDNRYHADVEDQFRRVLKADPANEDAVAGLGQMYFERADHDRALEVLEAHLATKPAAVPVLYWKGKVLYDRAHLAFQKAGSLTPEAKAGFEKALAAFRASAQADPSRYATWLEVAHAEQYLGRYDAAAAAYEKAIALDGEQDAPMAGLSAIHAYDAAKWAATLARLVKEHPKAPIVAYYHAYAMHQQKRWDEAEASARSHVATARRPAPGWYLLGQVLEGKGDAAGARKAYEQTLKAVGGEGSYAALAVFALEKPLRDRATEAMGGGTRARELMRDYRPLLALAPKNASLRNNLAFILREAFDKGGREKALLEASVEHYEEAVALLGAFGPEHAAKPWAERQSAAQVWNDAGVMYQYYVSPPDLKKAESYYRAAQEWSDSGYWDAYTNLMKILRAQERWKDAYDYALDCGGEPGGTTGLKKADGTPDPTLRATALGEAKSLEARLPKGD